MKRLPYALLILAMLTTIIFYQVVTIKEKLRSPMSGIMEMSRGPG
jgi:hypothetical protein